MSATILLNSERVSTQSIANSIQNSRFLGLVDHEPIGAQYNPDVTLCKPQAASRKPQAASRIARKRKPVTDKIAEIDEIIANNENYISIGWTNYSWADFFNDRWGNNVNFLALVRCPYETSLSLLTHGFFLGRRDLYARAAMINPSFKIHFNELGDSYPEFSPLEKALFHWLELYQYIVEFRERRDFRIWEYEEIRSNDDHWSEFTQSLCGYELEIDKNVRVDRHKMKIISQI